MTIVTVVEIEINASAIFMMIGMLMLSRWSGDGGGGLEPVGVWVVDGRSTLLSTSMLY
jgi:hypothetical protein